LIAEDDISNKRITKKVLKEAEIKNELIHLNNGKEKLKYLRSEAKRFQKLF